MRRLNRFPPIKDRARTGDLFAVKIRLNLDNMSRILILLMLSNNPGYKFYVYSKSFVRLISGNKF